MRVPRLRFTWIALCLGSGVMISDTPGVVPAAIRGSNQKLTEELERRDAENAGLKQRLDALEKIILDQKSK